jgi:hypothetical protein
MKFIHPRAREGEVMNQACMFFGAAGSLGWSAARRLIRTLQKHHFVTNDGE